MILCCMKSIVAEERPRRFPKDDGSPVASPPKAEVESEATMIGKPFDRARRRETSVFSKANDLSENSMTRA